MNESFLHFIWQFQYFDKRELRCTTGEPVTVLHPGHLNRDAGPDFHDAKLRLDAISWAGSVEIHLQASGWRQHRHHEDRAYDNVVLHVVWEEDEKIFRPDGTPLPALELRHRVSPAFVLQYKRIVHSRHEIPCASRLRDVPEIIRHSMLDRAVLARLEKKAAIVLEALDRNKGDWEETAYQALCGNFGFKVNTDPFAQLARALPYRIVKKHGDRLDQIEGLVFGQAGFLREEVNDPYYCDIRQEYQLLSRKYSLVRKQMRREQWRFLRLRPANFPTVRMAQLAAVLSHQRNLFSSIMAVDSWKELHAMLSVEPSAYWHHHYRFFKRQDKPIAPLGRSSVENIVINTIAPLLVAYGKACDDHAYVDRAVRLLQQTGAEENTILRAWSGVGWECRTAFDSQGLIELRNNFCNRRRCLDCNIGFSLLRPVS